ncbi:helix-turn-helix domain-containing protein [Paraburkholderia tropica]|uniref:helix-turn-helix domain-containing protein n=1 Tax=Paraburkholderia tropica TaxID=92647 RepID=UPI002AAF9862|nr:helix-turn-helix domain-containing protein [Paraburkholderia tropica]
MSTKRPRPSPDQWAKLDAALEGLRERTPPGAAPPLSQEITRRAGALRAALDSGWRIRDLAAFFRETAGIDVSPSTIQMALKQALDDANPDMKRLRAKRPRGQAPAGRQPVSKTASTANDPLVVRATAPPDQPVPGMDEKAEAPRPKSMTPFGSTLTQGATKRGQR